MVSGRAISQVGVESVKIFTLFTMTENSDTADRLLRSLDSARQEKWTNTVKNLDFSRSSRKAWSLLRKLSSGNLLNKRTNPDLDPSDIAKRIVGISKTNRQASDRKIIYKLNNIRKSQQPTLEVSSDFT